jgi:hypothetical protein
MYPEGLEFGTGVNSWITPFLFLLVLPPALLPSPEASNNPAASHSVRLPESCILPSPETHSRHAWRRRGQRRLSCQLLSLFSGIALTFALARKYLSEITDNLEEGIYRPFRRGPKWASPPNCCCLCLFFRVAARCLALARE